MENDLFICNEKNFINHIIEICNEDDENLEQEKIDNLYGVGLATVQIPIFLTNMTRQQQVTQPNTVFVRIYEDTFVVDPIPTLPINTACYFESNAKSYKFQRELNNFQKQHEEFLEVFLIFDDELDNQVHRAAERIIAENFRQNQFLNGL
ncbi:unnamed protein product [Paramecium octaurelia]|uniref:Uncharacterized protein n=1 Tax=Paramecium octaurelia TaxID=43137 RepID=A0A8S1WL33_PAROT|nr:unnamed protein product [Paramecium octaurelia]